MKKQSLIVGMKKPKIGECHEQPGILLEPRKIFDKAIVGYLSNGWPVYDFEKLIPAVKKSFGIKKTNEAIEWIDYNIGAYSDNGLHISSTQSP
jgi:hypothetical protein